MFWLFDGERSELIGVGGFVAPTPMALAAAPNVVPPAIGPGGWLIGNGLDALEIDPGCLDACDGGNGGLLWGNGGDGAYGGNGGNAGLFGNGGIGAEGGWDINELMPCHLRAMTPTELSAVAAAEVDSSKVTAGTG